MDLFFFILINPMQTFDLFEIPVSLCTFYHSKALCFNSIYHFDLFPDGLAQRTIFFIKGMVLLRYTPAILNQNYLFFSIPLPDSINILS